MQSLFWHRKNKEYDMDDFYRLFVRVLRSLVNCLIVFINLPSFQFKGSIRLKDNGGGICVLGNGPSLKNNYKEVLERVDKLSSVLVVNTFANTDYYELIKPSFYLIVDPAFFTNTVDKRLSAIQKSTVETIISRTKWKMTLFLPSKAKHSNFALNLAEHEFIKVEFFRNVPVYEGSEKLNRFLYKHNLANPPFRNVLIAAIFFSLKMGFSNINVWGADHSWHENLYLGKDNKLYVKDVHFFEEDPEKIPLKNSKGSPVKVHEELFSIGRALIIYHSLNALSESLGCKIVNRSSKTWIDAFERE